MMENAEKKEVVDLSMGCLQTAHLDCTGTRVTFIAEPSLRV